MASLPVGLFRHSFRRTTLSAFSSLPFRPLLPCRPYFRTPLVAAPRNRLSQRPTPKPLPLRRKPLPLRTSDASSPPVPTPPLDVEDLRSPHDRWRQVIFVASAISGVFLWAAAKTNAETDEYVEKLTTRWFAAGVDNRTIWQAKRAEIVEYFQKMGTLVRQETATLPEIPRMTIRESYAQAAENFINAPDALKVCWAICTFNAAVFIACRIPPLSGFMYRNFVHRPLSGKSRTLLTSIFGHGDIFHIVLNSMALLSFGAITGRYLNSQHRQGLSNRLESTTAYHFFAFFVAAGLFSSLASHMLRVKLYDAAIASIKSGKLATNGASDIVRGSLGASGAIYAAVTLTAMAFPNLHVSPIFVPVSVPIQYGVGGMVMLDIIGLLRGWRRFDHVAHLGGAVFGLWYYAYGLRWWDYWRDIAGYMFRDR